MHPPAMGILLLCVSSVELPHHCWRPRSFLKKCKTFFHLHLEVKSPKLKQPSPCPPGTCILPGGFYGQVLLTGCLAVLELYPSPVPQVLCAYSRCFPKLSTSLGWLGAGRRQVGLCTCRASLLSQLPVLDSCFGLVAAGV